METRVPFDHEASTQPDDIFIKDVITSETNHVTTNQPVKKQTRQWAAWTRQEEENFFTALRQVGKASFINFEKITSRVQSKNKDQVRHYYYRLVRRMNKLLGPELSLDAKNSKDTNAAMLRWWSLLEKHSCKASKLHLKPRRFKIFLETLEHQLLRDRKKNIRKRPNQGGNCSTTPTNKPARQRRRSVLSKGNASTNAYKKWEKAAIAGVSLVADAAEHLERTSLDKSATSLKSVNVSGDEGSDPIAKSIPRVPNFHQNMKLKLQLFPIDESTRRALEMDNLNPHLELTLSTRKRISSVLEHMHRKWGSSSIASGELTLVPYNVETLNCQKWTRDSFFSAGDVYAAIGSPSIFRLRYGWFAKAFSTLEWADSLTNISVGDLLSELSHNQDANCVDSPLPPGSPCQQQISFSCDSFDAAIAAHINGKNAFRPTIVSSIWDADETCDSFSFPKKLQTLENNCRDAAAVSQIPSGPLIEKSPEPKDVYPTTVHSMDEGHFNENPEDISAKDVNSVTDVYWSDSLGPLDLDVPSCRYTNDDGISSDSFGGLNSLLNSSLDAFQNCSFFGLEKRETPLTKLQAQETVSSVQKANNDISG
ncbi:hypothetical protein SSX86_023648 [Deinandra increscens subsp. villosa]|uniref:TSL-kinase interacting protein 1 n=1 Tax=Deinandra increscens subsp. villosa TaxID=3103831 RepID=A0AAP0CR16_9ASTR